MAGFYTKAGDAAILIGFTLPQRLPFITNASKGIGPKTLELALVNHLYVLSGKQMDSRDANGSPGI
jgi:hypothetical protein